jgi:hypothetical protein
MLIPDVAACLLHGEWAEDRAAVLERTFELGWRQAVGTDAFQDPMNALWRDAALHRVPTVFMNSTEAASGRRIVNSHVVLDPGLSSAVSLAAAVPPHALRLSTAAAERFLRRPLPEQLPHNLAQGVRLLASTLLLSNRLEAVPADADIPLVVRYYWKIEG